MKDFFNDSLGVSPAKAVAALSAHSPSPLQASGAIPACRQAGAAIANPSKRAFSVLIFPNATAALHKYS